VRHTHRHTYTHTLRKRRARACNISPLKPGLQINCTEIRIMHWIEACVCLSVCVCVCVCMCFCGNECRGMTGSQWIHVFVCVPTSLKRSFSNYPSTAVAAVGVIIRAPLCCLHADSDVQARPRETWLRPLTVVWVQRGHMWCTRPGGVGCSRNSKCSKALSLA